ncbi:MAG: carboxypeptidase-like regulatory domain-containing protein [Phocaeicola sp.]|nr:carboxypeptidase-like regulatory domain-containing protein [Phocaeicola sp.]MBR1719973.1 carboxypeptidase-like regulatory domain-containing protein [Phocaeicola sp.]
MKTLQKIFLCMIAVLLFGPATFAQDDDTNYITISGVVKDRVSRQVLPYVNISVIDQETATVTNSDGEFTLKIPQTGSPIEILIAQIGYHSSRIKVQGSETEKRVIWMNPSSMVLKEVVIQGYEPRALVREAIEKVPQNYDQQSRLLTGFYRETAKKRRHFINLSEAIISIYKTNYKISDIAHDKVGVTKGRKLVSTKVSDTLAVKLVGGPSIATHLDVVKNPNIVLSIEDMDNYDYHMEEITTINGRLQYVVSFLPRRILPYALYMGKMYIDQERLSFTRLEFSLDLSDRVKAIQAILRKKPAGLRFRPQEVSLLVDYTEHDGVSYLSYVRDVIRFRCDWNKKLFHTSYTVTAEMVVTDRKPGQSSDIARKDRFSDFAVLSDNVSTFYDEDFWGPYNIIQPEEDLDKAIEKLKKQHKP